MGKRAERKSRAAAANQKQAAAGAPKSVLQQSKPVESTDDGVPVMKERKPCPHLDKGIDSDKISVKIGSSDPIRCEDCREGVGDRRGKKGKGKHGKKKGSSLVDSKSDSKAIWVCLGCGHYACGGVGLPTTPQSHVVRHARQTRHPLVIQWENPHLRWCFPCNTLITVEKMEENGENKDALSEVVKLIKGRSTESSSVDVEDAWFGSGNVDSEIKSESTVVSGSDLDGNACYVVRGLANLGNTCFFNSVMQNLLAMSQLRDYFLNAELTFGPLTIALKKLFAETKPETGLRNVINPRSFFGCICSKAPQFKGYQQHDSHELLRCLLDGLCSEELAFRKRNSPSEENGISSNQGPVFVDYVFGGQIASTVRCVECGHSSTVYEPFLDLSLPVPTKKAPSKKTQPTSRAKKTKLPPKKSGRIRSKVTKDTHAVTTQSISNLSISSKSQSLTESTAPLSENVVSSSGGSQLLDSVGSPTVATQCGSALQNVPADPLPQHDQVIDIPVEQTVASLDDFWLDYIEPQTTGDVLDLTWQKSDVSVIQDSTDFAWLDYIEPETKSDEHGLTLQNNDVLFVQDSGEKDEVSDDSLINSNQIPLLDSKSNLKADSSSGDAGDPLPQHDQVIDIPVEQTVASLDDFWLDYIEPQTTGDVLDSTWQKSDVSVIQDSTDFAWLDYIEPETISDEHGLTLQNNDVLFVQDSGEKDEVSDDSLINSNQIPLLDSKPNLKADSSSGDSGDPLPQHDQVIYIPVEQTVASLDDFWLDYIEPQTTGDVLDSTWQKSDVSVIQDSTDFAWLDYIEPETISDEHGLTLQNNDVLFVQDSGEKDEVSDDSLINSNQIPLLDSKPNLKADSSSGDAGDPLPQHDQVIYIPVEQTVASLDDFWLDYIEPQTTGDVLDSTWQKSDVSVIQDSTDFAWLDYIEPETISDEHGLTLQNNDVLFVQDSGEKDEVSDDSLINSNQIPLLDSKPNPKADSSSGDAGEDELPLVVQDSEVILLPYNEEISTTAEKVSGEGEASSSVVGCRQEEVDFDGFGDLFNEPETAIGPVPRPSSGTESVGSGFVVGNSSDSDPDEVDDSDSPVSVESCLVHFIKPELLTDDNAWDCESCSKTLQHQKLEALKRRAKLASKLLINGGETSNQNDIQGSGLTDVDSLCNGDTKTNNDLNTFCESLVSQSGKTDCFNQDCAEVESGLTNDVNPAVPQREKGKMKINDAVEMQLRSSCLCDSCSQESITDQDEGSCSVDGATSSGYSAEKVYQSDSQLVAGNCESEESKVEETNSKIVKVKRDATKRVLINKAPPILTIHLKRFSQDARGCLSKLNGHVNFSEIINLRPYMDPGCTDHDNYDYRLVGVVEHLGTMRGGHYVAYVRGGPKNKVKAKKESVGGVWYHASDVYVREVSLEEVLRCEAYILFYEKI